MKSVQPYIIVPNLIPQPTWGGSYIANLKHLSQNSETSLGQSYELFSHSKLSLKKSTAHNPTTEIGTSSDPLSTKLIADHDQPFGISELIAKNPGQILGFKALKLQGHQIDILIKLTQAQENSFQLHTKKSTKTWEAKPESWYFLQPGKITLGIKPQINLAKYKEACYLCAKESENISSLIKQGSISLEQGRQHLSNYIATHSPKKFVNQLTVPKMTAVDLSEGGLHHSWEADLKNLAHGNIVYELQKNVFDAVSTLRSFDQGKIKNDGSVRNLNIDEYFNHLDNDPNYNLPQNHLAKKLILKKSSTHTICQIFDTDFYRLQQLSFNQSLANQYTKTIDSYHHLFVSQGNIIVSQGNSHWTVTQGFSIFIPASVGQYQLRPYQSTHATVLKTYL